MWLLILVVVGMFYVLSPLIFWATNRIPIVPTRRLAREEVPEPVAQAIPTWETALAGAGFSLVAVHELVVENLPAFRGAPPAHVVQMVNRSAAVHGVDYLTPKGRWQVFDTRFENGTEVVTSNFPLPDIFADPRVRTLRVRREQDLARLFALHQAHVRHVMGPGAIGFLPDPRGLLDYIPGRERRLLERQRALGMMTPTKGDVYRPTLRGAFLQVWAYLPPIRWMRNARNARLLKTLRAQVDHTPA